MKYTIIIGGLMLALVGPAQAGPHKCSWQSGVRICPDKYVSGPNAWGWTCEVHDGKGVVFVKTKGAGAKRKRDTICE